MKKGDRVLIEKGTSVHTDHPTWRGIELTAGRTYVVRLIEAYLEETVADGEVWKVYWRTGAYWKWAYLHNPEVISALEELARVGRRKS